MPIRRQFQLDADKIVDTAEILARRIHERFPGAGLSALCKELVEISRQARQEAKRIARPIGWVRTLSYLVIAAIIATLVYSSVLIVIDLGEAGVDLRGPEIVQLAEAGLNDLILVGAAIFFFVTLETRLKRRRALGALHELRSIAHVVDMHQLTKDPERMRITGPDTKSSPKRTMTPFELSRYLDYCGEMLSITGKLAALYAQDFADTQVVTAVNDIENLTSGLSRKIFQKLTILYDREEGRLK
ncbi:MAG: hypothetical protein DWQ45_08055 [Planctomycetota bacterium]|nr:MAG: hypothetical protein DWQ29_06215 [Planctomycetota bacterium]REK25886.1 MAG: hypothetical protein DWQ41_11245 [Planctomycetota bacterium]REK37165.1 MAG: hypothetical protein DWQ45_08055 [Planctomycetota bacterium]